MIDKITNHQEWLQEKPSPEDIRINPDGSEFLPIYIVESLLDQLTDTNWNTPHYDFESNELKETIEKNGTKELVSYVLLSGTVHLDFHYGGIQRVIIGCAQKRITDFKAKTELEKDNEDFKATMFSLALCNAAKKLGNRFGRSLNGRGVNKVEDKKEKESISEIEKEISTVTKLMVEGKTYDNAMHLFKLYPHLSNNSILKELAESLKK